MSLIRLDCRFCSKVWKVFTGKITFEWVTKDDILDEPCHHHFLQYIRGNFDNTQPNFYLSFDFDAIVIGDNHALDQCMRLVNPTDAGLAKSKAIGRVLDKDWVDLNLPREWKRECLMNHNPRCCDTFGITRVSPAWLIDTLNGCLVPGGDIQDFVILSYVWGKAPYLRNERAVLKELQKPGALSRGALSATLSPMIRHAIGLTRAMEERYLWADALCIVQDDAEQTKDQLMLMGKLYASATFTIVVLDIDGDGGIPGISGTSNSRDFHQVVLPLFSSDEKVTIEGENLNRSFRSDIPDYFGRAWTFQEYALSTRRLIVGKKQFYWICPSDAFFESNVSTSTSYNLMYSDHNYRNYFHHTLSGRPWLSELDSLMGDYNNRRHSFPEDALAGVLGILEILCRSFEGGFIYGMPKMYFHAALMWTCWHPLWADRRHHSGRDHSILQVPCLPSWSWLGWKGNMRLIENDGGFDSNKDVTVGIVQWYSHESPTHSNIRPVGPVGLSFPSTILDDTLNHGLAQGWTREEYPPIRGDYISPMGGDIFRHSSMPGGDGFWGWFPIKEHESELCVASPPQDTFISCKARRGWFRAQQVQDLFKYRDNNNETAKVYNIHENCCGWLQILTEEEATKLPTADSGQYQLVELVAICLRKNLRTDDRYGVLCVEWVDGVAYRKGMGEIEKEAWESHDLEDVDLILG